MVYWHTFVEHLKMSLGVSFWQAFVGRFALVWMMWIGTCFLVFFWFSTDWLWYAWITLIGFSELSMQELSTTFSLWDNVGVACMTSWMNCNCSLLLATKENSKPHYSMRRGKVIHWLASSSSNTEPTQTSSTNSARQRNLTWQGLAFVELHILIYICHFYPMNDK